MVRADMESAHAVPIVTSGRREAAGRVIVEYGAVVELFFARLLRFTSEKPWSVPNGKEMRAGVDDFLAGHAGLPEGVLPWSVDIPFGSRQDAQILGIFRQFLWTPQPA